MQYAKSAHSVAFDVPTMHTIFRQGPLIIFSPRRLMQEERHKMHVNQNGGNYNDMATTMTYVSDTCHTLG